MENNSKSKKSNYNKYQVEYWIQDDNLKKITEWAKKGLIIEQLCKNMGIGKTTFYEWKKQYPEINDAWQSGKLAADMEVVNALHRSATGYVTDEVTKELDPDINEMVVTRVVTKDVAPNTTAIKSWLNNRMPDLFKDNQLTDMYRDKVKQETEVKRLQAEQLRLQNELLKGAAKDTSLLEALGNAFKNNTKVDD